MVLCDSPYCIARLCGWLVALETTSGGEHFDLLFIRPKISPNVLRTLAKISAERVLDDGAVSYGVASYGISRYVRFSNVNPVPCCFYTLYVVGLYSKDVRRPFDSSQSTNFHAWPPEKGA